MGARWAHDLPAILTAAGIRWRTWPGWETRSRSSGGYTDIRAIGTHHTASNTTPDNDCRYMWEGSPDRPVGAVLLDRTGLVTIGAAGATNTQGKGGPRNCSRGTIPLDQGNLYTFSIEAANAGTGEPWPQVQQDTYVALCAALVNAWGLTAGDVMPHGPVSQDGWTDRKIDPAGQSRWAQGGASWNSDLFRSDVFHALIPTPPPEPPPTPLPDLPGSPDMFQPIQPFRNSDTRALGGPVAAGSYVFGLAPQIPAAAVAVALNVTAIGSRGAGFVTVWPGGPRPDTSCVNYPGAGVAQAAGLVVGVADHGFSIYTSAPADLIVDVTGYWLP